MKLRVLVIVTATLSTLALVSGPLASPLAAQQPVPQRAPTQPPGRLLGHNLLENAGCEAAGPAGQAEGWTPDDAFTCAAYGSVPGEWARNAPGAPAGGRRYFRAQLGDGGTATASQTIDISAAAHAVDSGEVGFDLSGFLGSLRRGADPRMTLSATFLDGSGKVVRTASTTPFRQAELSPAAAGDASLTLRRATGEVPVGTRAIEVRLEASSPGGPAPGGTGPALADGLSLILRSSSPVD